MIYNVGIVYCEWQYFPSKLLPWQHLVAPPLFYDATVKPSISANQSDASVEAQHKMDASMKAMTYAMHVKKSGVPCTNKHASVIICIIVPVSLGEVVTHHKYPLML